MYYIMLIALLFNWNFLHNKKLINPELIDLVINIHANIQKSQLTSVTIKHLM